MSATYLKNLFSYIVSDLSGITFSQVQFEWGIMATDLNHEVKALNSPIIFTVIDSTFSNINEQSLILGSNGNDFINENLINLLGAK